MACTILLYKYLHVFCHLHLVYTFAYLGVVCVFEIRSHVSQADVELTMFDYDLEPLILLPPSSKCLNYRIFSLARHASFLKTELHP